MDYNKYKKYKTKYLNLKNIVQTGGNFIQTGGNIIKYNDFIYYIKIGDIYYVMELLDKISNKENNTNKICIIYLFSKNEICDFTFFKKTDIFFGKIILMSNLLKENNMKCMLEIFFIGLLLINILKIPLFTNNKLIFSQHKYYLYFNILFLRGNRYKNEKNKYIKMSW